MLVSTIVAGSILGSTVFLLYSSQSLSMYEEFLRYGIKGGLVYIGGCLMLKFIFFVRSISAQYATNTR